MFDSLDLIQICILELISDTTADSCRSLTIVTQRRGGVSYVNNCLPWSLDKTAHAITMIIIIRVIIIRKIIMMNSNNFPPSFFSSSRSPLSLPFFLYLSLFFLSIHKCTIIYIINIMTNSKVPLERILKLGSVWKYNPGLFGTSQFLASLHMRSDTWHDIEPSCIDWFTEDRL